MKKVTIGIIGGAGYTAGELLRLLANHDKVSIDFVYSTSNAGNKVYEVHQDLLGTLDLEFTSKVNLNVDIVFLCLGHGNSRKFLQNNLFSGNTRIIDLSNDFRLKKDANFQNKQFVYGLPEMQRSAIEKASHIANPGCFATAVELALLPLADAGILNSSIHVNATTGATGAGVNPSNTTHFSWRDNNFSVYKVFTHQHLGEIEESLQQTQSNIDSPIYFVPNRGNFSRGIFASIYTNYKGSLENAIKLFKDYYKPAPFTHISDKPIHLKQVVNTNNAVIHLHQHNDILFITVAIDNLLKGAAGQAVENMNVMLGLEQTTGLKLKATTF